VVYSDATCVIVTASDIDFAVIQSTFHGDWVRLRGSTLRNDPRYTPTDCFETFPFPKALDELSQIGQFYDQHRKALTLSRQVGLTDIYNHFHDSHETATDITHLRELHREMDEAVARAYGWEDLDLGHGFHETRQGIRYTISEEARNEVLGRLLQLNHERYEEEVRAGLHDKGAKKSKGAMAKAKAKGKNGKSNGAVREGTAYGVTGQQQLLAD
jgi:hypothetical protein